MNTTHACRRFAGGFLICLMALFSLGAPGLAFGSVPPTGKLDFKVYRNGSPIGHHRFRFERDGDVLVVRINIELIVRLAFIPVYRYEHESRETWVNGRFVALESKTHDNGRDHRVSARLVGDALEIRGTAGVLSAPAGTRPGSHWNAANLREKLLIDTQFGSLNAVDVEYPNVGSSDQRRARLIGHELKNGERQPAPWLDIDLWYDSADILAGMAFNYGGSEIRYVPE
jgi:hypothetical protein